MTHRLWNPLFRLRLHGCLLQVLPSLSQTEGFLIIQVFGSENNIHYLFPFK